MVASIVVVVADTVTGLPCIDWRRTRAVAVRDRAEFRNEVTVLVQDEAIEVADTVTGLLCIGCGG